MIQSGTQTGVAADGSGTSAVSFSPTFLSVPGRLHGYGIVVDVLSHFGPGHRRYDEWFFYLLHWRPAVYDGVR